MEDFELPDSTFKTGHFLKRLKSGCTDDEDNKRTDKFIETFIIENGEEKTELYLKSDVIRLADIFDNFSKVWNNEFGLNRLYRVSPPAYT